MASEDENRPEDGGGDSDDDGLVAESLRGVLWAAFDNVGSSAIGVTVHIVLARLLVPEHFGLVALATVAVSFIGLLKDQGFATALIQRDELEDAHLHAAFWTLLAVGFVLCAIGVAVAPGLAWIFDEPRLSPVLRVMLIHIPLASVESVPVAVLKRNLRFKTLSLRTMVAQTSTGVIAIALAFLGWGVWALVAKSVLNTIIGSIVLWAAVDWRPRIRYSVDHARQLFSFGMNVTGSKVVNFANRQADDVIIGYFLGTTALGYYSVAYEILKGMTKLLSRTMTTVALPAFSRLQDDIPRLRKAWLAGLRLTGLSAFPIYILYIAVAPEFFAVVYGPKWSDAVPASRILSFIGVLHSVALFNPPVLKALGKPEWDFKLTSLNAVGNTIGFLIAAQFNFVWVAAAYVIRGYCFTPIEVYFVQTLLEFEWSELFRALGFPLIGCGMMVAAVFGLRYLLFDLVSAPVLLGVSIVFGLGLFAAYAFLFLPDDIWRLIGRIREEIESD